MVRALKRNPGSRHYSENVSYDLHRGYYYKDAGGRWRTPDGRVAAGQRREEGVYRLDRAETYNDRRRGRMEAIDIANYSRDRGVPMKLKEAREIAAAPRPEWGEDIAAFYDDGGYDVGDFDPGDFFDFGDTP